jgi:hypothetical protein
VNFINSLLQINVFAGHRLGTNSGKHSDLMVLFCQIKIQHYFLFAYMLDLIHYQFISNYGNFNVLRHGLLFKIGSQKFVIPDPKINIPVN